MNHKKDRGWFPPSETSNGASLHPHQHKKDGTSASVTRKHRPSQEKYVPPHQRGTGTWVKKSDTTGIFRETQMLGTSVGNNRAAGSCDKVNFSVSSSSETNCAPPLASSSCQSNDLLQDNQSGSGVGLSELREDEVSTPKHFNKGKPLHKEYVGGSLEKKILENSVQDEVTSATEGKIPLPAGTLSNSVEGQQSGSDGDYPQKINDSLPSTGDVDQSNMGKSQFKKGSPDRGQDNGTPPQFNICLRKHNKTPTLKSSFLQKNKEKREYSKNDPRPTLLRPGMVLLKNFITPNDQIEIIKKCQDLGVGPGGFYQPGYNGGAKLSLRMMCLGKDWDPQTRSYDNIRSIDGASPPIIPDAFRKIVRDAIQASYNIMSEAGVKNPDKAIPWMDPDICIVNFYTENGKLGLHQDRDETDESIKKGLPVVSFSIGDSAEFLYGDEWDVDKAEKIELKSGDVLIFGGKARRVFHGVTSIKPNSVPKFLLDEVDLRPGRLNLTFRQY